MGCLPVFGYSITKTFDLMINVASVLRNDVFCLAAFEKLCPSFCGYNSDRGTSKSVYKGSMARLPMVIVANRGDYTKKSMGRLYQKVADVNRSLNLTHCLPILSIGLLQDQLCDAEQLSS